MCEGEIQLQGTLMVSQHQAGKPALFWPLPWLPTVLFLHILLRIGHLDRSQADGVTGILHTLQSHEKLQFRQPKDAKGNLNASILLNG